MTSEPSAAREPRSSLMLEGAVVAEHLPGEPDRRPGGPPALFVRLIINIAVTLGIAGLTAGLWPLYLLLSAIYGWPPNVPRVRQVIRYLGHTWTGRPPPPGRSVLGRCLLTDSIMRSFATVPLFGLAWLLDEVLYGATLRATRIEEPLIEISAARSGSTQLARYLEQDPNLAAPALLQSFFPYLWLWRIVPRTIGRFLTPERVKQRMQSVLPPEMLQRHEADPFGTDTFDLALTTRHLNHLSQQLGPDVMADDFCFGRLAPHNRELWERDFVHFLDRVARKTLVFAGPAPGGEPRRFFVKGHFLCAADALERQYPDARFLTMIREPAPRLQSAVNFLRGNPLGGALGPPPWAWLGAAIARSESEYCELEQGWFSREGGAQRCVLRFSEYKRDLEGTMAKVYRECLDTTTLPAHVPRAHHPRMRTNYLLDRSLEEVGIDESALNERLADYIAWCRDPGSDEDDPRAVPT